jgi:hypothetical protein
MIAGLAAEEFETEEEVFDGFAMRAADIARRAARTVLRVIHGWCLSPKASVQRTMFSL